MGRLIIFPLLNFFCLLSCLIYLILIFIKGCFKFRPPFHSINIEINPYYVLLNNTKVIH